MSDLRLLDAAFTEYMSTHPHHETAKLLKEWFLKLTEAVEVKKPSDIDWNRICDAILSSQSASEASRSPPPEDSITKSQKLCAADTKKSTDVYLDRFSDTKISSPSTLPSEGSQSQPPEDPSIKNEGINAAVEFEGWQSHPSEDSIIENEETNGAAGFFISEDDISLDQVPQPDRLPIEKIRWWITFARRNVDKVDPKLYGRFLSSVFHPQEAHVILQRFIPTASPDAWLNDEIIVNAIEELFSEHEHVSVISDCSAY